MLSLSASEAVQFALKRFTSLGNPKQFAFVLFGLHNRDLTALSPLAPVGKRAKQREQPSEVTARLEAMRLESGGAMVARLHAKSHDVDLHCEAMLISRLREEPAKNLRQLQPLTFYSHLCPCPSCAARIADFSRSSPELRISLAYEQPCVPERYAVHRNGLSDVSSLRLMREAGVHVGKIDRGLPCFDAEAFHPSA